MTTMTNFTARLSVLAVGLCSALFAQPGMALVGATTVDANTSGSPYSGVVSLSIGGGTFSGVLLANGYVLTAAHVVDGASPGNVLVNFNDGSGQSIGAQSITIFPGYAGTTPGSDGLWHDDLALVKLSTAAPSTAAAYNLYTGTPTRNTALTLVGYGATGDGINGATASGNSAVKTVGSNRVDVLVPDDDSSGPGYTGKSEIMLFDFDNPTNTNKNVFNPATNVASDEAQFGGGDSGSPLFTSVNGQLQLIGIASFNGVVDQTVNGVTSPFSTSSTTFGSIGGATSVSAYSSWITSVTAVPEPQTYAMLLAGLGVLLFGKSRRRAVLGV
jgi:secreted trypsin-like serine protease